MTTNTQGASWENIAEDYHFLFLDEASFEGLKKRLQALASKERAEGERRGAERAVEYMRANADRMVPVRYKEFDVVLSQARTRHYSQNIGVTSEGTLHVEATLPTDSTEETTNPNKD